MSVMTLDERILPMPESAESGTRTVRVATLIAQRLQTVSALKDEMGEKFRPVAFLNDLLSGPVAELYEATLKAFEQFKAQHHKGKRKS